MIRYMSTYQEIWKKGYTAGTHWIPGIIARELMTGDLLGFINESYRQFDRSPRNNGFSAGHVAILVGVHLGDYEE